MLLPLPPSIPHSLLVVFVLVGEVEPLPDCPCSFVSSPELAFCLV